MSWSFNGKGTSQELEQQIEKAIEGYGPVGESNFSRREFEDAAPHLIGLAKQSTGPVSVVASGHGSWINGQKTNGECRVEIKPGG